MLELVSVDGVPCGELATPENLDGKMDEMLRLQQQIVAALLAQQQEIGRLSAALATVRISRTQELAIKEAISARARQLERDESLPAGSARRIAAAMRKTLRETTGARAIGDIQSAQFDKAMEMATTWRMTGALRRIRREMEGRT